MKAEDFEIRELCSADDAALEQVIRNCLIEYGGNHEGTAWADPMLGHLSGCFDGVRTKYFVAYAPDGTLAGGTGIGTLAGTDEVCELQKMYIRPEFRSFGLGSRLIGIALEHAKRHFSACYLETLSSMREAQKFYEKHGFSLTDETYGDTAHFSCEFHYIKRF